MTTLDEMSADARDRSFYLHTASSPVHATAHLPDPRARKSIGVLICPPLGWQEQCSHRVRRRWADLLAADGHPALRIDLQGTADSADVDRDGGKVAAWTDAVHAAASWLRLEAGCGRVVALGFGFGALLAWDGVAHGAAVDDLALWGCPTSGARALREIHTRARVLIDPRLSSYDGPEPPTKDVGLDDGDALDDAGQIITKADAAAISALDITKIPLNQAADRHVLLFERKGDERLRQHLQESGASVTICDGDDYEQMMQYVQFSSLPEHAVEDMRAWLREIPVDHPVVKDGELRAPVVTESIEVAVGSGLVRESIVRIEVEGRTLRGILAEPISAPSAGICGLFLSGGSDRRIGHNRIWVNTSRRWAAAGAQAVRIDPPGIGDSEGDPEDYATLRRQYAERLVEGTGALLDGLVKLGVQPRFMIAGFCSGGWRGFMNALSDERIQGVCAIDFPFFRWNWLMLHMRPSWINTREPRADESELKRLALRVIKVAMEVGQPLRRLLTKSDRGAARNARTLARLTSRGVDLTFVFRESSDPLDDMSHVLTDASLNASGPGSVSVFVAPGYDPRYRPWPIQNYVNNRLDEAMLKASARVRQAGGADDGGSGDPDVGPAPGGVASAPANARPV